MRALLERLAQLVRRRRRGPALGYFETYTGRDDIAWVAEIQHLISSTWSPNPDDPDHPISDPRDWLHLLVEDVCGRLAERRTAGDENLGAAMQLAAILALWGGRCAHAKSQDPRRPIVLRQEAYRRWLTWTGVMHEILIAADRDPDYFDQPWDQPFSPDATDGGFV